MNEHQLQSFVLAADKGSFSKAASESFITTPAIVQQINLLENDLGFKLFNRSASGITLTAAGESFYETAKALIGTMRSSRDIGRSIARAQERKLVIGLEDSEVPDFILPICELCRKDHPDLIITFSTSQMDIQLDGLLAGQSDLFIAPDYYPRGQEATFVPLYNDPFYCCLSPNHRLANASLIEPHELQGEKVYMEAFEYSPGLPLHDLVEYVDEAHIDHTPYTISLPATVLLNNGILPRLGKCSTHCTPPLVSVPLTCQPGVVGIICRKQYSEQAGWFIEEAKHYFSSKPEGIRTED